MFLVKQNHVDYTFEKNSIINGFDCCIGCDEVGVGPLAGPVVAGCCLFPKGFFDRQTKFHSGWFSEVTDSKKLSAKKRIYLSDVIKAECLAYGIGIVDPLTIDAVNIHQATMQAMAKSFMTLYETCETELKAKKILLAVDGRFPIRYTVFPEAITVKQEAVIKGDGKVFSIAAASILAKVYRDALMDHYDLEYPGYGFLRNKGYGTKEHYSGIEKHGVTEIHRKTYLKNIV